MSRRRAVGSKDANHDEIVRTFELLLCSVLDCHRSDIPGFPDLVVGTGRVSHLVEIKNPETRYGRRGLNDNQSAFAATWRGSPIHAVSTPDDAIALVASWRKRP